MRSTFLRPAAPRPSRRLSLPVKIVFNRCVSSAPAADQSLADAGAATRAASFKDLLPSPKVDQRDLAALADFIGSRKRLVVITGAGVSTESGIPDYRSPHGSYSKGHKPTRYQEFVATDLNQQRYWARAVQGHKGFTSVSPNASHTSLARLEQMGLVHYIITQNVDRLHQKAGSQRVLELHGHVDDVLCTSCLRQRPRAEYQAELAALNRDWFAGLPKRTADDLRPDADVELGVSNEYYSKFQVPKCKHCGGAMKPTIVFMGENVPAPEVERAFQIVDGADGLLCAGTSMMVYSAFRFAQRAKDRGTPIALLNIGETRADPIASLKVEGRVGEVLPLVIQALEKGHVS